MRRIVIRNGANMGRTAGFWEQDSAFPDGLLFVSPTDVMSPGIDATFTRAGKGLVNSVVPASATTTYTIPLTSMLLRTGKQDDEQQAFGSALGTGQQSLAAPPATFATNWGQSGRPPYTIAQNLVVPTSRPKGIAINSVSPVYQVLGAPLTSVTVGLSKTKFVSGIAPVVTDLIAPAQNGMSLAIAAQPTITPIANPNQNVMLTDVTSEYIVEIVWVAPAGSTVNFYGFFINVAFNHN
jgi:hypothetical protein